MADVLYTVWVGDLQFIVKGRMIEQDTDMPIYNICCNATLSSFFVYFLFCFQCFRQTDGAYGIPFLVRVTELGPFFVFVLIVIGRPVDVSTGP